MNGQFESILVTTRQKVSPQISNSSVVKAATIALNTAMSKQQTVTKYQERVYAALQQIPEGRITSYAAMSRALNSSPRAVGGALRVNPFAPEIPCHRCIASTGVRWCEAARPGEMLTRAVCWRIQGRLGECTQRAESDVQTPATERRGRVI
jgi:O-6-methylguanine DNA methyltransferase